MAKKSALYRRVKSGNRSNMNALHSQVTIVDPVFRTVN